MKDGAATPAGSVTTTARTTDEFGLLLLQLLSHRGLGKEHIHGVAVSCVVPSVLYSIEKAARLYLDHDSLVVGRGKTGMRVRTDNPREVGADRIVNSVAAYERWRQGLVIVDFGTATTFDAVSPKGEYLGGAISPGIVISMEALFHHASKLPRVEFLQPEKVVGRNTVSSMQSGLVFGYVGLVDGMCERIAREVGQLFYEHDRLDLGENLGARRQ